ncbi:MAG TPA: stage II sporulation protein R [Candidatus Butyricicoccus stercorigallinarum]|nr:stage II sporulation protein R [Candidatus Butyricicoccus stercorigallinarum]
MKINQARRARFELAIALTLFFALCYAAGCDRAQQALADDILRLRVVAHSDTADDQAVKLRVRDGVLACLQPLAQRAESREEMQALVRAHMQEIANAAQRAVYDAGHRERITACLAEEWYPTRTYDTFSLPAGRYEGLQIRIGQSEGHNWWCVCYPSLCLDAAGEQALSGEEQALIQRDGARYEIRFRTAELLGNLRGLLQ